MYTCLREPPVSILPWKRDLEKIELFPSKIAIDIEFRHQLIEKHREFCKHLNRNLKYNNKKKFRKPILMAQ